jgi:hypothetical protein
VAQNRLDCIIFALQTNHKTMKTTIHRIIEIPIEELQTEHAKNNWANYREDQCCLCGKKVGKEPMYVHYLTNGNIVSHSGNDIENSQGFFPVGSECAKKLVIQFAFC